MNQTGPSTYRLIAWMGDETDVIPCEDVSLYKSLKEAQKDASEMLRCQKAIFYIEILENNKKIETIYQSKLN